MIHFYAPVNQSTYLFTQILLLFPITLHVQSQTLANENRARYQIGLVPGLFLFRLIVGLWGFALASVQLSFMIVD